MDAATLFEQGVSALRLELASQGCPDFVIERAVNDMRADYARTIGWLRTVERSARRRNPFGAFKRVKFAGALQASR